MARKKHEFPCVMFYTSAQEHLPASSCTCPKKKRRASRTTLKRKADKQCGDLVRARGYCQASHWQDGVQCGGPIQWAHIIGRNNHRLRWNTRNALALCAGHHTWYTNHPWSWYDQISYYFPETWEFLRAEANMIWDKDYDAVFERLKQGDVKP